MLEHTLSEEERSQIGQTIEMFEVITQTQPDDYQSLKILKEAHQKLGNADDALRISRRLAEAYFNVGSYPLAAHECESILAVAPNAPEILAMLGDIEARVQQMPEGGGANALVLTPDTSTSTNGMTDPGGLTEIGGRNTGKVGKRISARERRGRQRAAREIFDRATNVPRGRGERCSRRGEGGEQGSA